MKRKLTITGNVLSILICLAFAIPQIILGSVMFDISATENSEVSKVFSIIFLVPAIISIITAIFHLIIAISTKNENSYNKMFGLIITTIVLNFALFGYMIYLIFASNGDSNMIIYIIGCAILLLSTLLIIFELAKNRKTRKSIIQDNSINTTSENSTTEKSEDIEI